MIIFGGSSRWINGFSSRLNPESGRGLQIKALESPRGFSLNKMYSLVPLPNLTEILSSSTKNWANPLFNEIFPIILYGFGILVGGYVVFAMLQALGYFSGLIFHGEAGESSRPWFIRRIRTMKEIREKKSRAARYADPDAEFFRKRD